MNSLSEADGFSVRVRFLRFARAAHRSFSNAILSPRVRGLCHVKHLCHVALRETALDARNSHFVDVFRHTTTFLLFIRGHMLHLSRAGNTAQCSARH